MPWKREKDGLVAELGAVFRIDLRPAGWECSVKTGRCTEIVNKGLPTQRASKEHAETYAAQVPEVAAAVAERKRTPPKTTAQTARSAAPETTAAAPPAAAPEGASAHSFERLDDGCIFGRAAGVCWVADDRGVEFAGRVDAAIKAEIESVAAQHFASARDEKTSKRAAALAKCQAAAAAARQAKKQAAETSSKGVARKTAKAGKAAAKKTAKTAPTAPAEPVKPAAKRAAKKAPTAPVEPVTPAAKKTAKKAGRGRKKAAKRGAKEGEPVARKSVAPKTKPAEVTAAVTWTDSGGEVRGAAAHGTFLIQPEGSRHALYFYEPGGQSRHLQSGDAAALRKAAEEMAARGRPAPERETLSAEKEEALLRMFAAGAAGSP